MKTIKIIFFLSLMQVSYAYADSKAVDFKAGAYLPITKNDICVETQLYWDEEVLVFGKDRFFISNKEEISYANVPKDSHINCDVTWKTTVLNRNTISVSYVTKCPAGSKNPQVEENKQTFSQKDDKILFSATYSIDGKVRGRSRCEYNLKVEKQSVETKK